MVKSKISELATIRAGVTLFGMQTMSRWSTHLINKKPVYKEKSEKK